MSPASTSVTSAAQGGGPRLRTMEGLPRVTAPRLGDGELVLPLPARGEVHLWSVDLDDPGLPADVLWSCLAGDERAAVLRVRHAARRRRKALSRGLLRHFLGAYLGLPPALLAFRYAGHGKPSLQEPDRHRLRFNLSHSGCTALFAFSREMEIGVDVEPLERGRLLNDAARLLCASEQADCARLSARDRRRALLMAWVRKEAMAKALGVGCSTPLTRLGLDGRDRLSGRRLSVCDLEWPDGHLASLAADGHFDRVRLGRIAACAEGGGFC